MLIAHAAERQRQARSDIYDVTVKRDDGTVIAEFRGHGRAIEGTIVPDSQ
jgi:acyl-CoA thioesterase